MRGPARVLIVDVQIRNIWLGKSILQSGLDWSKKKFDLIAGFVNDTGV